MHDSLGIERGRADEIADITIAAWRKGKTVTESMKIAAESCDTINELALAMLITGQIEYGFRTESGE